jgi:hypothetical protein
MEVMAKVLGLGIGIAVFIGWIMLVGPQVHVVESLLGLLLGGAAGGWTWWRLRTRTPRQARTAKV